MKMIWLTQGQFTLVDDEDYDLIAQWKWHAEKKGSIFYVSRKEKGTLKTIYLHRQLLGLNSPNTIADHIDRNGLNNQRYNLRIASKSQNAANVNSYKNSKSQFLGVSWCKRRQKWYSRIKKGDVNKHLGSFDKETDAAIAYNNAAIQLHGEFANLNIV